MQCQCVRQISEDHVETAPFEEAHTVQLLRNDEPLFLSQVGEGNMHLLAIDQEGIVLGVVVPDTAHDHGREWTAERLHARKAKDTKPS